MPYIFSLVFSLTVVEISSPQLVRYYSLIYSKGSSNSSTDTLSFKWEKIYKIIIRTVNMVGLIPYKFVCNTFANLHSYSFVILFNSFFAYRSSFNYLNSTFNTPQVIGKFGNSEANLIVLNWLDKILYRCPRTTCYKYDLHGNDNDEVLLRRQSTLIDLQIDPQTK